MTPADIGAKLLGLALPAATARRLAPLGLGLAILLALGLAWGAWQAFDWFNDRDAVRDAVNEANSDFAKDKDEATGAADIESGERRAAVDAQMRTTEELIDEALEKNCAVGEYLASGGAVCVSAANPVPRPDAQ